MKKFFGFTYIGWLNLLIFQWFFIRIGYEIKEDKIKFKLLCRVIPLSGWWSDYKYVKKEIFNICLISMLIGIFLILFINSLSSLSKDSNIKYTRSSNEFDLKDYYIEYQKELNIKKREGILNIVDIKISLEELPINSIKNERLRKFYKLAKSKERRLDNENRSRDKIRN